MTEYKITHENDKSVHTLRLLKNDKLLAMAGFIENEIHLLTGKPDKEFTREYGLTPAQELILHVAHLNKNSKGTLRIQYGRNLLTPGARMLRGAEKRGLIRNVEPTRTFEIKDVQLHLPRIEIKLDE